MNLKYEKNRTNKYKKLEIMDMVNKRKGINIQLRRELKKSQIRVFVFSRTNKYEQSGSFLSLIGVTCIYFYGFVLQLFLGKTIELLIVRRKHPT